MFDISEEFKKEFYREDIYITKNKWTLMTTKLFGWRYNLSVWRDVNDLAEFEITEWLKTNSTSNVLVIQSHIPKHLRNITRVRIELCFQNKQDYFLSKLRFVSNLNY